VPAGAYPTLWQFYLPQICNHCSQPACLKACPTGAIYKRDDGFVLIDQEECGGTRNCIKACPYGGISFNAKTKTSQKCIGCYPLVEKGEEPICVRSCIGKARLFGDLMNPDSFISRVIRSGDVDARPYLRDNQYPRVHNRAMSGGPVRQLRPDHGTSPNVWYIVPRGIPPEEVEKYFGMAMGGKREEPHEVPDNLKTKL
jgi:Fe-S-cluster-containing dehydrogenase component